jgi:hypothetical protein
VNKQQTIDALNQKSFDDLWWIGIIGICGGQVNVWAQVDIPAKSSTPELAATIVILLRDLEGEFRRIQELNRNDPDFALRVAQIVSDITLARADRRAKEREAK